MSKYKLTESLSIDANCIKACIFSGGRILDRAIKNGELTRFIGDKEETLQFVRTRVANQIKTVVDAIEGDSDNKAEIAIRLELYLINQMLDAVN